MSVHMIKDPSIDELVLQCQKKRQELIELGALKGLNHQDTIILSQQLDTVIIQILKDKKGEI